jgi:hypothetical protein
MTNILVGNLITQIIQCKTKQELDALRLDIVDVSKKNPQFFRMLQGSFIKKKNQIKRAGAWH